MGDDRYGSKPFESLKGERLTSVAFVLNYVNFSFDRNGTLSALTWPIVCTDNKQVKLGDEGYRDALCSLIGKIAQDARAIEDIGISVTFDDGARLIVSLKPEDRKSGEMAMLSKGTEYLWVW